MIANNLKDQNKYGSVKLSYDILINAVKEFVGYIYSTFFFYLNNITPQVRRFYCTDCASLIRIQMQLCLH